MALPCPKRLSLARTPTPLQKLERIGTELGVELYVKRDDLTGLELSGNKVRKLEFLLAEALDSGADTVVTCGGVQSNHCRATAAACVRLGLACHLILRTEPPSPPYDGNLLLDYLVGATFTFMPYPEYKKSEGFDFIEVNEGLRRMGKKPFFIPVGGSVAMGCWGYACAFEETVSQLEERGIKKAHFVSAIGSGGTHAGLVLGQALTRRHDISITDFNVCDTPEYFRGKTAALLKGAKERFHLSINAEEASCSIIGGYVGPGYAQAYPELIETMKWAAREEAIILDPVYSGKAFHGLVTEIRAGRFPRKDPIVFFHTGGVFGLFPQKNEFTFQNR